MTNMRPHIDGASWWRLLCGAAACVRILCSTAIGQDELAMARERLHTEFVADLELLAAWCEELQLTEQAATTRDWPTPPASQTIQLVVLPAAPRPTSTAADPPSDVELWEGKFCDLRTEQAESLFQLARSAIRAKRPSAAFELVMEALAQNPDHPEARRVLGFREYKGGWHTAYEIDRLRKNHVWHAQFGWLPAGFVPRYENDERYYEPERRWLPKDEEQIRRAELVNGWKVETEHYVVRTNKSLEAGVELAQRLERLYRVWQQTFIQYYASEAEISRLFTGQGGAGRAPRQFQVVFFRDRDEYERALASNLPAGVKTTGIYLADRESAFFFADDDTPSDYSTLYHEATHQLFHETRPVSPGVGRNANFWIIEGIACYMESLVLGETEDRLGGSDAVRFQDARFRRIDDNYYVPLAELTSFGMDRLQRHPEIARLYTQSSGLTHFLMHFDRGRYRDGLIAFLADVYSGRDRPTSLVERTGVGFDVLDRQYENWLREASDN